jgi:hypothetical protein
VVTAPRRGAAVEPDVVAAAVAVVVGDVVAVAVVVVVGVVVAAVGGTN